jgi:uncharacterized membrane protein
MVAGAVLLAIALIELSASIDTATYARLPRLFGAGADGARGMLSTIAGSVITVAGVTFSLTIGALAQASSQYTPRVLRTFMADRASQVVLGTFVGIFAYCLVVLRTIRGGDEGAFVPPIAVLGGFVLALVGVAVLVFFIHHTASGLQASTILARVRRATELAIDDVFPEQLDEGADDPIQPDRGNAAIDTTWTPVAALKTGYVQSVNATDLTHCARSHGLTIRVERGVGSFAIAGHALVSISRAGTSGERSGNRLDEEELVRRINDAFAINSHRTVEQDPAFGMVQIVDIALKGLSPGINDITTAVTCVDHLSALLVRLADRRIPPAAPLAGRASAVIGKDATFGDLLALAFDDVRRNAGGQVPVLMRLIEGIEVAASHTRAPTRRRLLARQLDLLAATIEGTARSAEDRGFLAARVAQARVALADVAEGSPQARTLS